MPFLPRCRHISEIRFLRPHDKEERRGFGNLREATILGRQRRREGDHPTKSCRLGFSRMRGIRRHRWHIFLQQSFPFTFLKKMSHIGTAKQNCEPTSATFSFPREKRKKQSVSISSTEQRRRAMATPLTPNKEVYNNGTLSSFPPSFSYSLIAKRNEKMGLYSIHCVARHCYTSLFFPDIFFREKEKRIEPECV